MTTTPHYYIMPRTELVRPGIVEPFRAVDLEQGLVLVRFQGRSSSARDNWEHLGHIWNHKKPVSNDHCMKLRQHGVLPTDSVFEAVMRVALDHPDMEP